MLARITKYTLLMLVFIIAAGASTYLTIHLLIRSRNTVVVPNLIEKEVVYALELLTDLGLNTKVKEVTYHPSVHRHQIIAQDPEPGTEIKPGRDVRLVISRGPRTVIIPNLTGLDLAQASLIIDQNGLKQGQRSHVFHRRIPREGIVSQYPHSGSTGARGNRVDLLVSAGKRPKAYKMMDLTGMGLNQAMDLLENSHLQVGNITVVRQQDQQSDTVVAHNPTAGHPINQGSLVGLTVNRPDRKHNVIQRSQNTLFRHRVAQGFLRQHVRIVVSQPTISYDIFNDFVKPGSEIWLSIPHQTATTLFLYVDGELIKSEHY